MVSIEIIATDRCCRIVTQKCHLSEREFIEEVLSSFDSDHLNLNLLAPTTVGARINP